MPTRWKQLWELETTRPVVGRLEIADTAWKRAVGLLGRARMEADTGLWLEPCNGIHTLALRFPIDVLFLDREGRALRLVPDLPPWRTCGPVPGARIVVELPAGTLKAQGIRLGQRYMVTSLEKPDYPLGT